MTVEILIRVIIGVIGFFTGLALPWIKWAIQKRRLKREEQQSRLTTWSVQIETFDFDEKEFGDTGWYSSLRLQMTPEAIANVEADRTTWVLGGRGGNAIKQMLYDEVSRLENEVWKL